MKILSRRKFLGTGLFGTARLSTVPLWSNFPLSTPREAVFIPYPKPLMPAMTFVYAADEHEDPFKSSIHRCQDGIVIPEEFGARKSRVNTHWYVESFRYIWLSADNGGEYFSLPEMKGMGKFNLNYEFAPSRVVRNQKVLAYYRKEGTSFSSEVKHLSELSEELLQDSLKKLNDGERAGRLANKALPYALWAGEKIELEKATSDIQQMREKRHIWFGCESRQYIWVKPEEFVKRFSEVSNFATLTHYVWDSWYQLFEQQEGYSNWGIKDDIVNWLLENNITIQGRSLFWFHPTVTPDWLKQKKLDELKKYVEKHTQDLLTHYGDKVLQWKVVNECPDWANIHNHTPEQITEITHLAFDKTNEVNPNAIRILDNCYHWADYVSRNRIAPMDATRPFRTPRQFIQNLHEANVEYDVLRIQNFFSQRDLSDIFLMLERLATFGKPIYITEIGASSNLLTLSASGAITASPNEPYASHRHWDEELQANWLEQVYTIFYSKPYIKAIN